MIISNPNSLTISNDVSTKLGLRAYLKFLKASHQVANNVSIYATPQHLCSTYNQVHSKSALLQPNNLSLKPYFLTRRFVCPVVDSDATNASFPLASCGVTSPKRTLISPSALAFSQPSMYDPTGYLANEGFSLTLVATNPKTSGTKTH